MIKTLLSSEEKFSYKLITLATLAVILVFLCKIVYAGLVNMPYPKYMGDTSSAALTNAFLEKNNPYLPDSLAVDVPGINYSYPFLNSLLALWLVNVFKVESVNAHFLISLMSILLSGYFGYRIMKKYSATGYIPFLAGFLLMLCHWNKGFISSSPNDLGMLIYIISLYIVSDDEIEHRPAWLAALATICFYTMPAYLAGIVPALIYVIIRSKKNTLKTISIMIAVNAFIAWSITVTWPLYWSRAFVLPYHVLLSGGMNTGLLFITWIARLLAPPSVIIVLGLIDKNLDTNRKWLDICISAMAVIIASFVGLFMLHIHILTEDEINEWKRAYDYTKVYSMRGQVYYSRCMAYDKSFNTDNGDCLYGDYDDEFENMTSDNLQTSSESYSAKIIEQNLRYADLLRDMAREHSYKLISIDDGYNIFDAKSCAEYGYTLIDKITLRTGNESHEVEFYAPKQ